MKRSAIKTDLFASAHHREKIDELSDSLHDIEIHIDFSALAHEVDLVALRPVSSQGGLSNRGHGTDSGVEAALQPVHEQMEYQLLDRMNYQRFCGLEDIMNIPDRTTIWSFEQRIGETGAKALFDGASTQLLKKGFIAGGGQIIDASLVPATKQRNGLKGNKLLKQKAIPSDWKPAKSCQKDSDTSKGVYADRGYPSRDRENWLKENGYRNQIQRKGSSSRPLSGCQQRRNHRITKTRAWVEHIFAAIEQMGGKAIRTIGQYRANFAMIMMATCYNPKRLVYLRKSGIVAF